MSDIKPKSICLNKEPKILKKEGGMKFLCCDLHAELLAKQANNKQNKISKSDQ